MGWADAPAPAAHQPLEPHLPPPGESCTQTLWTTPGGPTAWTPSSHRYSVATAPSAGGGLGCPSLGAAPPPRPRKPTKVKGDAGAASALRRARGSSGLPPAISESWHPWGFSVFTRNVVAEPRRGFTRSHSPVLGRPRGPSPERSRPDLLPGTAHLSLAGSPWSMLSLAGPDPHSSPRAGARPTPFCRQGAQERGATWAPQ